MKTILGSLFLIMMTVSSFAQNVPDNFHSFGQGLYRGARPSIVNLQYLKSIGVTTVIDLQGGDIKDPVFGFIAGYVQAGEGADWIAFEKKEVERLGMRFVNVPLNSLGFVTGQQGFALGKIMQILDNAQNASVFIHCEHGKDRTGMVVALHRVIAQSWSPEKAHAEMVELGHGALNQIFTSGMDDFFWAVVNDREAK